MKILNELLVFVALPALIYHFRLLTCRDVSRAMASEYAAVQQLVKLSVQQGHLKRENTDKSVADTHKGHTQRVLLLIWHNHLRRRHHRMPCACRNKSSLRHLLSR